MTQAEFQARIASDPALQSRFISDPQAVLAEYAVDNNELSDAELDSITAGTISESAFVHRVLTAIFDPTG